MWCALAWVEKQRLESYKQKYHTQALETIAAKIPHTDGGKRRQAKLRDGHQPQRRGSAPKSLIINKWREKENCKLREIRQPERRGSAPESYQLSASKVIPEKKGTKNEKMKKRSRTHKAGEKDKKLQSKSNSRFLYTYTHNKGQSQSASLVNFGSIKDTYIYIYVCVFTTLWHWSLSYAYEYRNQEFDCLCNFWYQSASLVNFGLINNIHIRICVSPYRMYIYIYRNLEFDFFCNFYSQSASLCTSAEYMIHTYLYVCVSSRFLYMYTYSCMSPPTKKVNLRSLVNLWRTINYEWYDNLGER